MIDDSMIKRLAAQTGLVDNFEIGSDTDRQKHLDWECVTKFARACYAAGREDQRESDAALCDKDMHLALRTNQTGVAMGMKVCASAIRASKEPPDHTPVEPEEVYSPNTIVLVDEK